MVCRVNKFIRGEQVLGYLRPTKDVKAVETASLTCHLVVQISSKGLVVLKDKYLICREVLISCCIKAFFILSRQIFKPAGTLLIFYLFIYMIQKI